MLKSLKSEVNDLSEIVKQLTTQVQTLSAALGLNSNTTLTASQPQPQQTSVNPVNPDNQVDAETVRKSYATVAKSGVVQQMHRNIVSAMYVDLEQKKKRANNVVISGLTNDENFDDKAVVTGLIYKEFGRQVAVKYCRRLGRRTDGKVQNLLVSLSSADEASYLISNARHLRRSSSEFVRKNIYINADLTPAEAKASYELRCAHRQRISAGQNTRTRGRSTAADLSPSQARDAELEAAASSLNPSAPVFSLVPANEPPSVAMQ